MNVSASNNVVQQQQDQNELYTNNYNHLNNLVSNNTTFVSQLQHQVQQQQQQQQQYQQLHYNSENENDTNNNFNSQQINDLKQQQQNLLQQINMNLPHQSALFQITGSTTRMSESIHEQNDSIMNSNSSSLPSQSQQPQQQQQPKQQQGQRFRIVKTDAETNSDSNKPVIPNGVDLNNTTNEDINYQLNITNNQYYQNINQQQQQSHSNGILVNGISSTKPPSYLRGRWLVTDSDSTQLRSVTNNSQQPQQHHQQQQITVNLINQPVLNSNILNNSNSSNSPITIANNSCALTDDQIAANIYSNFQKDNYVYGPVNSNDNSIEQIQINQNSVTSNNTTSSSSVSSTTTTTTTTLPNSHFNPISTTLEPNVYSTQSVYQTNQPITNPTNITIKPVPMVPHKPSNNANIPQKVIQNIASSSTQINVPLQTPTPTTNNSTSTPVVADTIIQSVNTLVAQLPNSSSQQSTSTQSALNQTQPSSSGNSTASSSTSSSSTATNLSTTSGIVSNASTSTTASSSIMSNIKEKLQNTSESIQLTQSSINSINIVSLQQPQKETNIDQTTNDSYNQTNQTIHNSNEQQTSNSNLHYQQTQQQPVYEVLNVSVSNPSSSNSDFMQTSPKDTQLQHTNTNSTTNNTTINNNNTNTSIQVNNNLSNQSSSSIPGNSTPPVTNLASSSSSSSATIDQTAATLNKLPIDLETGVYEISNENEKSKLDNDKGIKSRIELAMDLVKTHLTSAVNQEILSLKNQIEKLTEKCARLEQENQILRKHALPETLALIENRNSGLVSNQTSTNSVNLTQSNGVNNSTSSTQVSVNDSHNLLAHSTYISESTNDSLKPTTGNNSSLLLTTAIDTIQDSMTSSMIEHISSNKIDPLQTTHSNSHYNDYDSLNNHKIHNSDELNINENKL